MIWKLQNRSLSCDPRRPLLMGILNVTPDSFSDGGSHFTSDKAVAHALLMEQQGADIIDIGGESTRPQSTPVSTEEELRRVLPVIESLRSKIKIPISIDTTKAIVAKAAINAGAEIINDISATEWDPALLKTVVETQAGYVLMHCQGRPQEMQRNPQYQDVTEEIFLFLKKKLENAVNAGVCFESVVMDVGFGFGKTMEHQLTLLKNLKRFTQLNRPILLGVSRKSFLRQLVGQDSVEAATTAAHLLGSSQGVSIWRTHDIPQAVAARKILEVCS
jgi:dihydropteroate synthase